MGLTHVYLTNGEHTRPVSQSRNSHFDHPLREDIFSGHFSQPADTETLIFHFVMMVHIVGR